MTEEPLGRPRHQGLGETATSASFTATPLAVTFTFNEKMGESHIELKVQLLFEQV